MYLGSLWMSARAAIGIAQLATGPQKCVLKKEHYIVTRTWQRYLMGPQSVLVRVCVCVRDTLLYRWRHNHYSPHEIIASLLALQDLHYTIHLGTIERAHFKQDKKTTLTESDYRQQRSTDLSRFNQRGLTRSTRHRVWHVCEGKNGLLAPITHKVA